LVLVGGLNIDLHSVPAEPGEVALFHARMPPKEHRPKGRKKRLAAAARRKAEAEADTVSEPPGDEPEVCSPSDDAELSTVAASEAASVADTIVSKASAADAMVAAAKAAEEAKAKDEEMLGDHQHRELMDEALSKLSITFLTQQSSIHPNSRDIKVEGLNIALGRKELVKDATLSLSWGNRYGFLGANGSGKSLLMTIVGRRLLPMPSGLDVYHLVSEVEASEMPALKAVLAVDTEKHALEAEAATLETALEEMTDADDEATEAMSERIAEIYEQLDQLEAETAEARAASILHGLGFSAEMQAKACRDFSGGWRMRIALARALFLNPSVLLLDEPTNHLDMEAVVWLEKYLAKRKQILLMVSHSQDFLNAVTTHTIYLSEGKFTTYTGNYDSYEQTRAELEENQMKRYHWEQEQIKHMKQYINRFGHGNAKLAKQAQSKEKTLAKMEEKGLTAAVKKDRSFSMRWPDPGTLPPPVLQLQNISFNYPGGRMLYKDVDFGVDLDSRVALVGPNGAGKTTLLKLIASEIMPTNGQVKPHPHLRLARYTQHFVDMLDLEMTPLEYFASLGPLKDETEQQLRQYIGKFGVTGEFQTTVMKYLSDGIKSRVVFAQMAVRSPHILLLDEPTNHLDIETIDSLADAINAFKGGVVLVSHDMRLISQVAQEIWECDHGTITRFVGDISDYKAFLARRVDAAQKRFEEVRRGGEVDHGDDEALSETANSFAARELARRTAAAASASASSAAAEALKSVVVPAKPAPSARLDTPVVMPAASGYGASAPGLSAPSWR
jgi:ATP-binding cassette, subfamily F, member 2